MRILMFMLFGSGLMMSYQCQFTLEPNANHTIVQDHELPEVYSTEFESVDDWTFIDDGWKHKTDDDTKVLSLHKKATNYKPEFRSPGHIALLNEKQLTDFQADIRVLSTHEDYNHRDVCLFFGYQSPSQYYYVHLGKKTDPHANQIFIVNKAARTKISITTSSGTNWDEDWHNVRIQRDIESGEIQVFFDDMETPVMTAMDKTFTWGQFGVGSFDDTADFDDLQIRGKEKVAE